MAISSRNTFLAALAFIAFQAQAVNVTVAYQTSAEPAKVAQADNTFAKESGATVDWRKFDSGASIVRALASGDVQIGNLGSSPLAVATSQQVPIEVFLLASKLGVDGPEKPPCSAAITGVLHRAITAITAANFFMFITPFNVCFRAFNKIVLNNFLREKNKI